MTLSNKHVLLEKKIIVGTKKAPLMVLEKHSYEPTEFDFLRAKEELFILEQKFAKDHGTWGYFPQIEDSTPNVKNRYRSCKLLAQQISNKLLHDEKNKEWILAFLRLASKKPASVYTGLHKDTNIGILHEQQKQDKGKDIVRVLINLHSFPRTLAYIEEPIEKLRKKGLVLSEQSYEIVPLTAVPAVKYINIPPRDKNVLYLLKFISSQLLHVGQTNENGHFLLAYGRYVKKGETLTSLRK